MSIDNELKNNSYSLKKCLFISLCACILDQATKTGTLLFFKHHDSPTYVTSFFNYVLAWNTGVSFSMFHSNSPLIPWILTLVALCISGLIFYWMKKEQNKKIKICFALIFGGAIGNIVDRIHYGAVVDFLDFHIKTYHWPAFNVADSCICIGAFFVLIYSLFFATNNSSQDNQK
ncbi:MAG: signal peptidase II [Alphaproteobacteria bacterium]|nr:signal peptidase II [Alphaproteobacteria bacterium]